MSAPHGRDIAGLSALLRARRLSAVDLVDALIARAAEVPHIYVTPLFDEARAAAREADREIARGGWRGPLHGIPFGVKDAIDMRGVASTACSRLIRPAPAGADAEAVARLRRAGAIPLGKVHCAELCLGAPGPDDAYPWPRNPHDAARSPGGSSSGSGAGLAAGLFPAALGTDTAGSVRLPAAFCGLAGLKPTDGLVPTTGVTPLAPSLDQIGPMGRSVRDCALLLEVLSGGDAVALTERLEGVRLGIDSAIIALATREWRGMLDAALATLSALGAEVREVTLPPLADVFDCALTLMLGEAYATHGARIAAHPEAVSQITRERIEAGASRVRDLPVARAHRAALSAATRAAMAEVDALLLPVTSGDPPLIGHIRPLDYMASPMITTLANVAGLPALSVRCGTSAVGLPMALQLIAAQHRDAVALRIGHAFEHATPELSRWQD